MFQYDFRLCEFKLHVILTIHAYLRTIIIPSALKPDQSITYAFIELN